MALSFDGINDRLAIADHTDFELTRAFTIEASVWVASLPRNVRVVFRGDERSSTDPYTLTVLQTGQPEIAFHDGVRLYHLAGSSALPLGTWCHLAGTFDSDGDVLRLYVDGIEVASMDTQAEPLGALDGPLPGLGIANTQSGNQSEWFHGYIDEVRISSIALAPDEFLFPPHRCDADLTGDGLVDTLDFLLYLGAWAQGDPLADWDENGTINTLDFLAFLNDWVAGC